MQANGWTLLFHTCLIEQLQKLEVTAARAQANDPVNFTSNANVKLFQSLSRLIFETIPADPGHEQYRQGNTMGPAFRHWRRAKIGQRFRLFFRYDSAAKVIVYAWVNDAQSLRSAGSKTDPYIVFSKMLARGCPPDDWAALVKNSQQGFN